MYMMVFMRRMSKHDQGGEGVSGVNLPAADKTNAILSQPVASNIPTGSIRKAESIIIVIKQSVTPSITHGRPDGPALVTSSALDCV